MSAKLIIWFVLFILFVIFVVGNAVSQTKAALWYFKLFHLQTIVVTPITLVIGIIIGWFIPSPLRRRGIAKIEKPKPEIQKEEVVKTKEPRVKKEKEEVPREGG